MAILVEETAHFGRKVSTMNRSVSFDCVASWWHKLDDLQKSAFADDPAKVSAYLNFRVKEIANNTFVVARSDEQAIQILAQDNCGREQAEISVKSWRKYASNMDYSGPVAWKIKQGFTLKIHAPLAGPCYEDLEYLQTWPFADTPTVDSLVFWVPRLAEQSTNKNATQMEIHRTEQRQAHNLPSTHCDRFGSIASLFALILAHFKRTGERVPLRCLYAASDTIHADGARLVAGVFNSPDGLDCYGWRDPVDVDFIGFFLLGINNLSLPAQALTR